MIAIILALLAVVNVSNSSVTYACNGVTATYQVNFPYLASTDLVVTSTTVGGSVTTLTPGTDWSVNFASTSSTATLTLTNPAVKCSNTNVLKIARRRLLTQPYGFRAQGVYNQALHEAAYDSLEMQIQQVNQAVLDVINPTFTTINNNASVLGIAPQVVRTLLSKLKDLVSVKDYGAQGDCATDDTPFFVAALADAKTVYVPDPTVCYRLTSTVGIPADTMLWGNSKRSTKIQKQFNGDLFTMADGAAVVNLWLDGNGGSFTGRGMVISGTDGRQVGEHVRALSFDGTVIDFTSVAAGSQSSWTDMELTRTAAGTGTGRYAVNIADAVQLSAVPRKFDKIETSGNCAFSFGGSNNTQIMNSVLGDNAFSTNSRGVKLLGSRWLNQVAATIDGHNISIVGCDVLPALTIAVGSDHVIVGPNSQNANAILDLSASVNGTFITSAPVIYTPVLSASTANPVIGNGVLRGEYSRNGSVIHVSIEYTIGSTDTFGTGTWRFSLPVTPPGQTGSPTVELGQGYCRQAAGATFEFIQPVVIPGTAFVVLQRAGAGGPQVTNAAPFAWAAGDIVRFTIDYHL